jgi:hypothetical protein
MAYNATYTSADTSPAVFDFVVGIFVGLAGFGVLIGLGLALGMVGKHLPWVKLK